jgi:hypothetical protein
MFVDVLSHMVSRPVNSLSATEQVDGRGADSFPTDQYCYGLKELWPLEFMTDIYLFFPCFNSQHPDLVLNTSRAYIYPGDEQIATTVTFVARTGRRVGVWCAVIEDATITKSQSGQSGR